ncbi:GNAT family N-acetyltransferase [Amycolatopsis sp. K13G38]|uniref:GNAT family N-acetyltransferase n=1 Tax=Amycolatopsis acididurans TaxID=2724524 RepID=A0ABX1J4U2_9PSEU|nr:GNAT family N-acetyltransferase [Amycolatopsis acididurans]NKQ54634.1 GNAT family N-acetyltransferase [Amycolatopsis acididurans]
MIALRRLTPEDWEVWRELRLAALRDAAYAFKTSLAEWQDAPEQRWRQRLTDVELNVLAECDGEPAGIVSGTRTDGTVRLLSMYVAPFARGRGAGDALVRAVVRWAGESRVLLRVFDDNEPAKKLYRRNGFVPAGLFGREREMAHPG